MLDSFRARAVPCTSTKFASKLSKSYKQFNQMIIENKAMQKKLLIIKKRSSTMFGISIDHLIYQKNCNHQLT